MMKIYPPIFKPSFQGLKERKSGFCLIFVSISNMLASYKHQQKTGAPVIPQLCNLNRQPCQRLKSIYVII